MARKSQGRFQESRSRYSRFADQFPSADELETGSRPRQVSSLNRYFSHHLFVAISTLGQLVRAPFSTLLTTSVIAIALALPAGFYVLLANVQVLTNNWHESAQISVFLQSSVDAKKAQQLQQTISRWKEVEQVHYISPDKALAEFRQSSGFGDVLDSLGENPLPPVLVVFPVTDFQQPQQLEKLTTRLKNLPNTETVQQDMEWVRRLAAMISLGKRGVLLLAGLFALAILLIIGNTIRLTIFNRRQEILVTKLIGGTNGFIRRPFLYTGIWFGLFGALLAWLLLGILIALIKGPVHDLAMLYQSRFTIDGLGLVNTLLLIISGITLGFIGSWLATSRHLNSIEPV